MRRSGLAIGVVFAALVSACLSPAQQAPSSIRASVEAELAAAGASYPKAMASPDFIRRAAITAREAADWVIDFNEAQGSYCGTGGCPLQIWVRDAAGRYQLAFDQQVLGWRIDDKESSRPTLAVRLHGALCGRTGIEVCAYAFRWEAQENGQGYFVPARSAGGKSTHPGPLVQAIRLDPERAPTPARYAVKAFEAACERAGGEAETQQSLQYLPDLDGDGAREMLFDASLAWCWRPDGGAAVRPDCKAGSCNSRLFTREAGRWREVLAGAGFDYEIEYRDGPGAVMTINGRALEWTRPSRPS